MYTRDTGSSGHEFEVFPFNLRGGRRLLFWWTVWTFLGLLQAARLYVAYNSGQSPLISWPQALTWALADWYIWGLLSLVIFRITRFTEFTRSSWPRDLALHLVAAFAIAALQLALYTVVYRPLGGLFWHNIGTSLDWTFGNLYVDLLYGKMHAAVLTYFLIAFIYFTLRFHARYRSAEQRRLEMETRLTQARLDALQMQLQPHFLFNTLNAITSLIHSDPEAADRMTGQLGELLRLTLDSAGVQEVTLRQELDYLERYLDIQRTRFADRMAVDLDVSQDALDAYVPNLVLQPLVENSIVHGVSQATDGVRIRLMATRRSGRLELEVSDDGSEQTGDYTEGRGLANTRARLEQLYGDQQELLVQRTDPRGFRVFISFPYHDAPMIGNQP